MASQDEDTHQVGNLQKSEDLITLHAYSPPLKNIDIYSLDNTIYKTHEQTRLGLTQQMR